MSITHISKSETLKNNRLETGHIFLLISLLDKKCIHLAIFYYPCSMYLSPIPLLIQSMPFFITLPWYHMPIVWMPHCNMLIVWLPLTSMPIFHTAILLYDKKQYAIPAIATEQESQNKSFWLTRGDGVTFIISLAFIRCCCAVGS